PDATAGLATAGAAFHWFDQARTLAEVARVLRPGAALVIYTDFFHGKLAGRPAFTDWLRDTYLPAFPGPARHAHSARLPSRPLASPRRTTQRARWRSS
ncbi:MAG: methyltransferase domain-containing protein, partial [Actinomycetota bacterium]